MLAVRSMPQVRAAGGGVLVLCGAYVGAAVHDLGQLGARFSVWRARAIRIAGDLPGACIKAGVLFL